MNRAITTLATLLSLATCAAAQTAGSVCNLDQSQVEIDYGYLLTTANSRWQEFVPTSSVVCEFEFNAYREGDPGDFLIELLDSSDQVLASTILPESSIASGWITVPITATPVEPGAKYKLSILPLEPHTDDDKLTWWGQRNSSYTQGITSVESTLPHYDFRFRTKGQYEIGTPYCFGDGGGAPCPCNNEQDAERGCANSSGKGGELRAIGSPSVALNDLQLLAADLLPNQPALLFSGQVALEGGQGQAFGDGLRCAGQSIVRFQVRVPSTGGLATWGPGLGDIGGWSAGDTRMFQAWYRDPAGPCGTGYNLSNGVEIHFL